MKRYRVLSFQLDSRALILGTEIKEHWDDELKELWRRNKEQLKSHFVFEYGEWATAQKLKNCVDLGPLPFSIVAFHNTFLTDCRSAFIIGSYYPSLTGAAALGERILNHLLLRLREYFRSTPEYKAVWRKESFDNWTAAIDTLAAWDVLLPDVVKEYRQLEKVRNRAIHFRPETDHNDRDLALEALRLLQNIIGRQFGAFGTQPWFIRDTPGEAFIAKDWETRPFIENIYLPNCVLVGPKHYLEIDNK